MVGKTPVARAVLVGALCLPILPALAQEAGGLRLTFGIDQRLELADNLALEDPAEGSSATASTRLSFGLLTETQTQRLRLDGNAAFFIEDTPDTDGVETDFRTPELRLSYTREAADALFDLSARYRESDVDRLDLADFTNEDGVIVLPEDFGDLRGQGTRTEYGARTRLELGREAPVGFVFGAGFTAVDYSGTSSGNLDNFERSDVSGQLRLRLSPVMTATTGLRQDTFESNDPQTADRTTTTADLGLEYALSPRTRTSASLGFSEVERTEGGVTDTTSGLIGSLRLDHDMPNGAVTADLDVDLDEEGDQRANLLFGRSLDLPDGALSARLGLTSGGGGDVGIIGGLDWRRDLPDGAITARIDRRVSQSSTDESRVTTLLALGYSKNINALSGLDLALNYAEAEGTSQSEGSTRTSVSATYRRALTEDWNLNTGVSYRTRSQDDENASSPSVFLSIGRRFEVRP